MKIYEAELGQRVVLVRTEGLPGSKSRLTVGMKGVVVALLPSNRHTDFSVVVVLWEGLIKGWLYDPATRMAECLKEQPTYPGAPQFGEPNAWGVPPECVEPLVEEAA